MPRDKRKRSVSSSSSYSSECHFPRGDNCVWALGDESDNERRGRRKDKARKRSRSRSRERYVDCYHFITDSSP